jgi:hypothetical protein
MSNAKRQKVDERLIASPSLISVALPSNTAATTPPTLNADQRLRIERNQLAATLRFIGSASSSSFAARHGMKRPCK